MNRSMKSLQDERDTMRRHLRLREQANLELNEMLLSKTIMGDYRPLSDSPPEEEEDLSPLAPTQDVMCGEDVKSFDKHALPRRHSNLSQTQLEQVLCALGLNKQGRMTTSAKKDQFVQGIRTLCDIHFSNHDECQRADIIGELLFNSRLFSKERV